MSIGSEIRDKTFEGSSSARSKSGFSSGAIHYFLLMADGCIILLASFAGGIGYNFLAGNPMPDLPPYGALGLVASLIYILRMNGKGYYDFPDSAKPGVELSEILLCWFATALLLALLAFLLKVGVDYSRGAFVVFCFLAPVGLLGIRKMTKLALAEAVSRGAIGARDMVLVGDFNQVSALGPKDLLAFFGAIEIDRFFLSREDDRAARLSTDAQILSSVANFVRRHDCREILLALPWDDIDRIEYVREQIKTLPIAARLLPDMKVRSLTNFMSSARRQVLAIEIQRAPLSGAQRLIKRTMDVILAALALIFFVPIMLLTAIAIRLDSPGSVIFRQNRNGFNGRQFVIYKFRTMTVQENGATVLQATRDDPRVTTIGRLLRSTSIDELPQLFNVLKGDMSLIGPRPHALAHDSYFENVLSDYAFRHHVKPGITGWAQCNGARGATPSIEQIAERVKLDLWYINNWSLWLDIQILIKTFFEVLRKRNAY
jgi:undecaprenyl-phosphate galactose phosphotransferase/putative colanic acid biosynthesis UDP-glucose lipid carrier transferase